MKRISVTEEAYGRLLALRREDETFSDLILRLSKRRPLSSFAGILSHGAVEEIRRAIEEGRKERDRIDRISLVSHAKSLSPVETELLESARRKAKRAGPTRKRLGELVEEAKAEVWKEHDQAAMRRRKR